MTSVAREWTVGELAQQAGVSARTLHHYDQIGLVRPGRSAAGHRRYTESDVASQLFNAEGEPHRGRFRCFESYRRSLRDPEIITFDELLERATAAVNLAETDRPS